MSAETLTDIWRECVAAGYGWRPGMLATDGISVSYRLVSTRRRRKTRTWSACRGATEAEALLRALLAAPKGGE